MKKKKFDAVKMMRDIRENLAKEFARLSSEEKITLLEKEFPHIKTQRRQKVSISSATKKRP